MWHPWKRRIAELDARVEQLAEQRDDARAELAVSRGAVARLAGRNTRLSDQLEMTRVALADQSTDRLYARLHRVLRAVARYRAEGAEDRAAAITAHQELKVARAELARGRAAENAGLIRELQRSQEARASLATQLADVQKSNDFMCRERVAAAGTLTTPLADVEKPGEVAW